MNNPKWHNIKNKKHIPNIFSEENEFEDYIQTMFESLPPFFESPKLLQENCLRGIYPTKDEIEELNFPVD